ncbi:MAG: hypothetical protein B6D34_04280 [Candidatus Brocadia sp. UTAMX1]|jgi:hypothetical protein|nr:MAG: hypothetical protein B6D34_04280 [Candidatus Brocadia sp. UTAMX1]
MFSGAKNIRIKISVRRENLKAREYDDCFAGIFWHTCNCVNGAHLHGSSWNSMKGRQHETS